MVFGAVFLLLFVVVAAAEGIGDPSIPSDSVAVVEEAPGDVGDVTDAEFKRALDQSAAAAGAKEAPKPGDPQYEEIKEAALKTLFEGIWIQGLAAERGITVSEKELDRELQKAIDESFGGSKAEFEKFLKEARYTDADVEEKVTIQALSGKLQKGLGEEVPEPTEDEIENYYEAAKSTQFKQQASRDIRQILNKEEEKAEMALGELRKDNSAKSWEKVAKKYSEDPESKENGGLREAVQEEVLEEPLGAAVFDAPEGELEGPLKTGGGYVVFEVTKSTPESFQGLDEVKSQIESTLGQEAEQEFFGAFVADFQLLWRSRTFCAGGYVTEQCANFKGDGRPATATPSCYEEDPKEPPEACPAPVSQLIPAMPGSVTPLEPKGKPLAQRPQPVPAEGAEEATASPVPPVE